MEKELGCQLANENTPLVIGILRLTQSYNELKSIRRCFTFRVKGAKGGISFFLGNTSTNGCLSSFQFLQKAGNRPLVVLRGYIAVAVVGTFLRSFQGISAIIRNFTNAGRLESLGSIPSCIAQQRKANEK